MDTAIEMEHEQTKSQEIEGGGPPEDPKERARARLRKLLTVLGIGAGGFFVFSLLTFWILTKDLPVIIKIEDYRPPIVSQVVAREVDQEGEKEVVVGEFLKERRYVVPFEQIPEVIVRAFLAAEDDRFFEHQGISFIAILRVSIANFKAGHVVQGGSTITQQVARSLFLSPEKRFIRKFKEAVLAYRMERNLTKEQILFLYLNQIYLGAGAYGVQAASRTYFRKDLSEMTLPEAALLAGMTQAPVRYSPFSNPTRAKERQRYVLRRMHENRFISEDQLEAALATAIRVYRPKERNQDALYLVEHIRRHLSKTYGDQMVYEGGLRVEIPGRPSLMAKARRYVQDGLRDASKRRGYRGPLRRIEDEEERIAQSQKEYERLMWKRVDWKYLTPEGEINHEMAIQEAGVRPEDSLLNEGELYEAVVSDVRDREKKAVVKIGLEDIDIPMEQMKWARPVSDEKYPPPPPRRPSEVVKVGDVVLVKIQKPEKPPKKRGDETLGSPWVAHLEQHPEVQGGLFSIEANTGYVMAMVGGYEFGRSEFNRVTQAQRQPGSAFKPIIYSAALEQGFTPATIIVDSPIVYSDEEFGKWKPTNFKERFYGDTTFRLALIKSRNIPTIKLVQELQIPHVVDYSRRLGMMGQFNEDLSISLGSATTSLLELTQVYSLFPRQGRRVDPVFFTKVIDRDGLVLEEHVSQEVNESVIASVMARPAETENAEGSNGNNSDVLATAAANAANNPSARTKATDIIGIKNVSLPSYPPEGDPNQLMDPRVAYVMTHLLGEVVNYGTGQRAKELKRTAAGKTGTTNDYKDAWFLGFTPDVVTGVWVGFDDQRSLGRGETGSRAALPVWINYMKDAIEFSPEKEFNVPPGIVFAQIDRNSGKLTDQSSVNAREEAFIAGTEPTERTISGKASVESESEFFKEDYQ